MAETAQVEERSVEQLVEEAVRQHGGLAGPLLPILHHVQDALGYVSADAVRAVAEALNLARAEVHGVVSYYPHFLDAPAGQHRVQICCSEACQAVGGRSLQQHAQDRLGVTFNDTTSDRTVTLEPIYCLGNCANGPAVRIDHSVYGAVTADRLDELLAELGTGDV